MKEYHLHLKHRTHRTHNEYWTVVGNQIKVISICPDNHPSKSEHTLTPVQALRQYALMTSRVEGWEVEDEKPEWQPFVEQLNVEV